MFKTFLYYAGYYTKIKNIINMSWYKIAQEAEWVNVDSSCIDAVAYYPSVNLLDLKFRGGREYTYIDVPKTTFENFLDAESKGKFFNDIIKPKYDLK